MAWPVYRKTGYKEAKDMKGLNQEDVSWVENEHTDFRVESFVGSLLNMRSEDGTRF